MNLLIIKLLLALTLNIDYDPIVRYELEVQTTKGEEFEAYLSIFDYDETKFYSNAAFKNFIFTSDSYRNRDSISFFKKFYHLSYPPCTFGDEPLTAVLEEDIVTISKLDIAKIVFGSYKKFRIGGLVTPLTLSEIRLLQSKPVYYSYYSIDPYQEAYSGIWILSYNEEVKKAELNAIVKAFKAKYKSKTKKETRDNSYVYGKMIKKWQKELKIRDIYLIKILSP